MTSLTNTSSQCHITPRQPRIPRGRRPQNHHFQKGQGCRPGPVSRRGRRRCGLCCCSPRHSKWQQEQIQRGQGSGQRPRQSRHQPLHTVPSWRGKQQERDHHHRASGVRRCQRSARAGDEAGHAPSGRRRRRHDWLGANCRVIRAVAAWSGRLSACDAANPWEAKPFQDHVKL
jgi:hypothetical protein